MSSTPTNKTRWIHSSVNGSAPVAVTDLVGGAAMPAASTEIGYFQPDPINQLIFQLWGESGATYKVLVAGVQQCADDEQYQLADLLEVDVLCRTTGAVSVKGTNLYPAESHNIVRNAANAKALDGSTATKCSGAIMLDALGFRPHLFRVNVAVGPKAFNIAVRGL